ncbi:MAG: 30S ribosomal protein S1 [Leptospiraceae bacterium]|nr:30S ribosomal protein S1 [Leptospiraceae bacterium]MCP5512906.1 30S ribosomal protein S1 [Leptospiraceae bacterium]
MKDRNSKFAQLLEENFKKRKSLESGTPFRVSIVDIRDDYIFVKTEDGLQGILSTQEFQDLELPRKGEFLDVYFLREDHGDYYFTYNLSGEEISIESLEIAQVYDIPVVGQYGQELSNGYEVKLDSLIAFCPFSQIDSSEKSKSLSGVKSRFIIHEIQSKSKKIIVSSKKLSDKEKLLKRDLLKEELKEGSFVSCTIKSIHKFGLIVDMNGVDALIPQSETSFKRGLVLENEFQVGQSLRAQVLQLDWKENKFTLSLKSSLNDPWANSIPYKEGDIIEGTIESLKPFGIFVKLSDTFHCLVPNKETGLPLRTPLNTKFKQGDKIEVFIQEVNPVKRQISASIEKAKSTREELDFRSYLTDQEVSHSSSFGLLLKKSISKKEK